MARSLLVRTTPEVSPSASCNLTWLASFHRWSFAISCGLPGLAAQASDVGTAAVLRLQAAAQSRLVPDPQGGTPVEPLAFGARAIVD